MPLDRARASSAFLAFGASSDCFGRDEVDLVPAEFADGIGNQVWLADPRRRHEVAEERVGLAARSLPDLLTGVCMSQDLRTALDISRMPASSSGPALPRTFEGAGRFLSADEMGTAIALGAAAPDRALLTAVDLRRSRNGRLQAGRH